VLGQHNANAATANIVVTLAGIVVVAVSRTNRRIIIMIVGFFKNPVGV